MIRDNIIKANFWRGDECRTSPVWQYDYGMILQIEGLALPSAYEVHFTDISNTPAIVQIGGAYGVNVPDSLLQAGKSIIAHIYLHTGNADGETVKTITIPVTPRASISDVTPTPAQQTAIEEAIESLSQAVSESGASAEAAEAARDRAEAAAAQLDVPASRVTSLDAVPLAHSALVEAVGIPVYVSDVTAYSAYGLTDTGWYTFARINAPDGVTVSAAPTVTGAHSRYTGGNSVDVAVRFDVASVSRIVTVAWDGAHTESFVFKATDLAVRNLDYRTTFYVYDLAPFVTWTYALTADATFQAGKNYYVENDGEYTLAEVTAGEAVPADTYYNHSKLHIEGMARNVTYQLDEIVDCASEIVLPAIEDDGHGAWFEFRFRHSGSFSSTLLPEDETVKVATEHTQAETAGMNMVDLHYMSVAGMKIWRFMNTHSTIPT